MLMDLTATYNKDHGSLANRRSTSLVHIPDGGML